MYDKKKQQTLTLEKLEPSNIWYFCWKMYMKVVREVLNLMIICSLSGES